MLPEQFLSYPRSDYSAQVGEYSESEAHKISLSYVMTLITYLEKFT